MKTMLTIAIATMLGFGSSLALSETCDPKEIDEVIELAHLSNVELSRTRGLSWIRVTATPEVEVFQDYADEEGLIEASAIEVLLSGRSCSAIAEAVLLKQGERWLELRVSGENAFSPRYYQERLPIDVVDIGFDLILFQKAYCDITVNALIYKNTHPALRLPPQEDPQC